MTDYGALVRSGSVPCIDGLFRVDGTVRRVDYDGPSLSWFEVGPLFVPADHDHPKDLVNIDWADCVVLPAARVPYAAATDRWERTASSLDSTRTVRRSG